MSHVLDKFQFCPVCGSSHFEINNIKSKKCKDCGFVLWIKEQGARGAGLGARSVLAVVTCHRRGNLVGARYAQARCGDVAGNIVRLDARRHTGLAPNAA